MRACSLRNGGIYREGFGVLISDGGYVVNGGGGEGLGRRRAVGKPLIMRVTHGVSPGSVPLGYCDAETLYYVEVLTSYPCHQSKLAIPS